MAADYDQVRLAEILVAGRTFIDPEDDEGEIRASHILYEPEGVDEDGEPIAVADLPADDPAWEVAETAAEEAAAQLRNVEDAELRQWAFARRAFEDSMGPSGPRGGDLGFFTRDTMVEPFGNAVFDAEDPQPGDIIGPVRSEFGWHVIQYTDFREPLADRLAVVEAALAEPDADFAEVARERSEAESAADGGDIGWQVLEQLDDLTVAALSATEVGGITTAVDGDRGWYIYQLLEEATRPLDGEAAAELEESAFDEWYSERRFGAADAERISIDDSVYEDDATTPGTLPMGGQGG
jgi:parvulin-like peptidyl-prolyl isomerase